jgi:hypothetical protein
LQKRSRIPSRTPALTGNVKITSNSATAALTITQDGTGDILRLNDVSGDTTFTFVDAAGKVNTVASTAASAGLNVPHTTAAPTTPVNGDIWTTTAGLFVRINSVTQQFAALSTNNIFSNASSTYGSSTATGTTGLATGATISASIKTVNVATGGVVGSTTLTTIGPVLGASTTSIGGTTAASTLNLATGATMTATTKAVNIGTAGVAGSTTNIVIGSTTGTSTTTLQGATNGITQTAGNNTTLLATTAFVTAANNLKAPLVSPVFTGDPQAPTPATADNDTSIATTAFVKAQNYITSSALSPYLLSSTAASTYYPLTNPSGFITSASLTGYALLAGSSNFSVTSGTIKSKASDDNFVQLNETRLEFGNGITPSGLSVTGTGITFADSTVQTTAAVSGLPDAPSDGSTYGRKDGAWEVVSGGGGSYLPLAGGTMDANALVGYSNTYVGSSAEVSGYAVAVWNTSDTAVRSVMQYDKVSVTDGYNTTDVKADGITFADSTVQTTAAVAGVNLGDVFSMSNVQDVTFAGSYPSPGSWTITFRPVNSYIANGMTLVVENGDGSISQDVKGAVSTASTWTYTTTFDTFPADTYLYIVANGIKATIPINYP